MAKRRVAVAGVYATRQARVIEEHTPLSITLEAVAGALADAGLSRAEVDGAAVEWAGPGGFPNDAASWARMMGGPLSYTADGPLESAGARAVAKASAAISAGLCDVVVIGGGNAGSTASMSTVAPDWEFGAPFGAYAASEFAMVAARHMHEFGTTSDQLAHVATVIRNNGSRNPAAVMFGKGPYTVESILQSRPIASPLHLLDVCLNAQGGAAIVLTTLDRARDLRHPVIEVIGAGMEYAMGQWTGNSQYRQCGRLGATAVSRALDGAELTIADIDVFSIYDPTSFEVIRQLEIFGLCAEGEGGSFVEGNRLCIDGPVPVNPDGGLLSYSWTGVQQMTQRLIEGVHQLRAVAGDRQVAGARTALITNAGSGAQHYEVAVLGRE
jgi:acetyl-CoA acetyltransferase